MHKILTFLFFTLMALLAVSARAADKVLPWMMADWSNPAPHLAEMNIAPRDLAGVIGKRLVLFSHPARDIAIPSAHGLRRFPQARFVTAVARVDLPAQTMRHRMQDFSDYKHLFPLLAGSDVLTLDGKNVVARYRVEVPLPALATFTVDFRIKHALEADGSISSLLIDGTAESLIAMLGGISDELADQPVLSRWEFVPLNKKQSLLVFTYWDKVELKSFFARKFMAAYPELKVVGPYMVAADVAESIHRNFVAAVPVNAEVAPLGMEPLVKMQGLLERLSANGHVVVMEPEQVVASGLKVAPLRYVSMATRLQAPVAESRHLATSYERLPEALKELSRINANDRGRQVDLDLTIKFGFMVIRFSMDMDVLNTWVTPDRLEFSRTAGDIAQLRGASEWHPINGSKDSLMLISVAHEVGEEAPFILRMAHKIADRIPYIDPLTSLAVQMVIMERMKPWIEKNAVAEKSGSP